MLDVSGSMEGNLGLLRAAAEQLFRRLRPDDRARVGTFGHDITLSPSFTRDPDELRSALPSSIATDAPTPLWRAIDEALEAFGNADRGDQRDADRGDQRDADRGDQRDADRGDQRDADRGDQRDADRGDQRDADRGDQRDADRGDQRDADRGDHRDAARGDQRDADRADQADSNARPVILVFSDGKDSGPIGFRQRFVSQVEVIERARDNDVMVYAIGMRSRGRRPVPGIGPGGLQAALMADLPDPGLARVAEETGGGYTEIRFGQDLGAAFAQVADELHSQYLIGYAPPKRDGKVHDIDVRLSQRGLKPRARKSYIAPKQLE
jgi:VWFA-related protein